MNDAPALKRANVGIAVAGATAAAKGAADIILTEVLAGPAHTGRRIGRHCPPRQGGWQCSMCGALSPIPQRVPMPGLELKLCVPLCAAAVKH